MANPAPSRSSPHSHVHDVAADHPRLRPGVIHRTGWMVVTGCPFTTTSGTTSGIADWYGIDMRSAGERAAEPVTYSTADVVHSQVDLTAANALLTGAPSAANFHTLNLDTLAHCGPMIAELITVVAERMPRPVVLGCSLGKDRTGVVVAVLMALLDVPDEVIVAQDRLARSAIAGCSDAVAHYVRRRPMTAAELVRRCNLDDSALRATLEVIRTEYGGAEAYLVAGGAPVDQLRRLRETMIVSG